LSGNSLLTIIKSFPFGLSAAGTISNPSGEVLGRLFIKLGACVLVMSKIKTSPVLSKPIKAYTLSPMA